MSVIIERPAALQDAVHTLRWETIVRSEGINIRLRDLKPSEHLELCRKGLILGGPTGLHTYAKALHCLSGVQLAVTQQVGRDLERSSVSCSLANVPPLAEAMEFVFEDPTLPSVLMAEVNPLHTPGYIFVVDSKESEDTAWVLSLARETLSKLLDPHKKIDEMGRRHLSDSAMEAGESEAMRYMALLCLKVLAYSQIPHLKPSKVLTHAERRSAGLLSGDKYRPERPAYVVRYLPRVIRPGAPRPSEPTGAKRQYLGRGGHIRHFNADFFTNRKGTWSMIPPSPCPEGVKIHYKVRSVKPD